jgi:hypothetical protein
MRVAAVGAGGFEVGSGAWLAQTRGAKVGLERALFDAAGQTVVEQVQ